MATSALTRCPLLALHLGLVVPFLVLATWFGLIDRLALGEERCASCGVELYVVMAHLAAAGWLGLVVTGVSALRRQARGTVRAPGRNTVAALVIAAAFTAVSFAWSEPFTLLAMAGMLASFLLIPAGGLWWLLTAVSWRRPAATDVELGRRATRTLIAGWLGLGLLLPGVFGWVWVDRVAWLVF